MVSLSGAEQVAISWPVITGLIPSSVRATSNASWLFLAVSSDDSELKSLKQQHRTMSIKQAWSAHKLFSLGRKNYLEPSIIWKKCFKNWMGNIMYTHGRLRLKVRIFKFTHTRVNLRLKKLII